MCLNKGGVKSISLLSFEQLLDGESSLLHSRCCRNSDFALRSSPFLRIRLRLIDIGVLLGRPGGGKGGKERSPGDSDGRG